LTNFDALGSLEPELGQNPTFQAVPGWLKSGITFFSAPVFCKDQATTPMRPRVTDR